MIGQLQDAGDTATPAHYLELLAGVGMLTGLLKVCRASGPQACVEPQTSGAEHGAQAGSMNTGCNAQIIERACIRMSGICIPLLVKP